VDPPDRGGGLGVVDDLVQPRRGFRRHGDGDDTRVETAEEGRGEVRAGRQRDEHAVPGEPSPDECRTDRPGALSTRPEQVDERRCPCHVAPLSLEFRSNMASRAARTALKRWSRNVVGGVVR
jgi:hypothetical protein